MSERNLCAVPDQPTAIIPIRGTTKIPEYEGHEVTATAVVMSSIANIDVDNVVLGIDDIVHGTFEGRVVGVAHMVNEKTGLMTRVQRVKVLEVAVQPWDPGNPHDTGVVKP